MNTKTIKHLLNVLWAMQLSWSPMPKINTPSFSCIPSIHSHISPNPPKTSEFIRRKARTAPRGLARWPGWPARAPPQFVSRVASTDTRYVQHSQWTQTRNKGNKESLSAKRKTQSETSRKRKMLTLWVKVCESREIHNLSKSKHSQNQDHHWCHHQWRNQGPQQWWHEPGTGRGRDTVGHCGTGGEGPSQVLG